MAAAVSCSSSHSALGGVRFTRDAAQPVVAMNFYRDMLLSPVITCWWTDTLEGLLNKAESKPELIEELKGAQRERVAGRTHAAFAQRVTDTEYTEEDQERLYTFNMRLTGNYSWHNESKRKDKHYASTLPERGEAVAEENCEPTASTTP